MALASSHKLKRTYRENCPGVIHRQSVTEPLQTESQPDSMTPEEAKESLLLAIVKLEKLV